MVDWDHSAKGRFGALLRVSLQLLRFVLGCACASFFGPYAILGILVGSNILGSLDWGWPVGLLMFACGLGGVIGLFGYLVRALGYERRLNALLRSKIATSFAMAGGVPPAAWLVTLHYSGVQSGRNSSLQDNLPIWLLTFLLIDVFWMLIADFFRKRLCERS